MTIVTTIPVGRHLSFVSRPRATDFSGAGERELIHRMEKSWVRAQSGSRFPRRIFSFTLPRGKWLRCAIPRLHLGPTNKMLIDRVNGDVRNFKRKIPISRADDLLTSPLGLDPHISLEAAAPDPSSAGSAHAKRYPRFVEKHTEAASLLSRRAPRECLELNLTWIPSTLCASPHFAHEFGGFLPVFREPVTTQFRPLVVQLQPVCCSYSQNQDHTG